MTKGNEPAFAASEAGTEITTTWQGQRGLTKREYAAIKAMQGLLSNPHYMKELVDKYRPKIFDDMNRMIVIESIDMADELFKALES